MRLVLAGATLSDTAALAGRLARALALDFAALRRIEEPYLWQPGTQPLGPPPLDALAVDGLRADAAAPRLLDGRHGLHDAFVDALLPPPDARSGEAVLVRTARGAGRLGAILSRADGVRAVVCLRNPVSSIDAAFAAGDPAAGPAGEESAYAPVGEDAAGAARAWWSALTARLVALARDAPERVHLVPAEVLAAAPRETLDELADWLGLGVRARLALSPEEYAPPVAPSRRLLRADIAPMLPALRRYAREVLAPRFGEAAAGEACADALGAVEERAFAFPRAGHPLARQLPRVLLDRIVDGTADPVDAALAPSALAPEEVRRALAGLARRQPTLRERLAAAPHTAARSFGCVVVSGDDAAALGRTLVSVLDQSRPYDRVLVVDRGGGAPRALAERFAERYGSVDVLALNSPVSGVAARHLGFWALASDAVSAVDAGDLAFVDRNAAEAAILEDDFAAVAFCASACVEAPVTAPARGLEGGAAEAFATLLARPEDLPREVTLARETYFAVGGLPLQPPKHAHWGFLLRLASRHRGRWRCAPAGAGVVHAERADPQPADSRSLLEVFWRALGECDAARWPRQETIAAAMLAMLGPQDPQDALVTADILDPQRFDPEVLARLFAAREVQSLPAPRLRELIAFVAGGRAPAPAVEPAALAPAQSSSVSAPSSAVTSAPPASAAPSAVAEAPGRRRRLDLRAAFRAGVRAPGAVVIIGHDAPLGPLMIPPRGAGERGETVRPVTGPSARTGYRHVSAVALEQASIAGRQALILSADAYPEVARAAVLAVKMVGPRGDLARGAELVLDPQTPHAQWRFVHGWHLVEPQLVWSADTTAFIAVALGPAPRGARLRVRCGPQTDDREIAVSINGLQAITGTLEPETVTAFDLPAPAPWRAQAVNLVALRSGSLGGFPGDGRALGHGFVDLTLEPPRA